MAKDLDAHAKPPADIRDIYKEYQKLKPGSLDNHPGLIQFDESEIPISASGLQECFALPPELRQTFHNFLSISTNEHEQTLPRNGPQHKVYEIDSIPGLYIYPSLLPANVQLSLLGKLFHRDLSNQQHQTNLHLHYNVPYPTGNASYFSEGAFNLNFSPKNSSVHRPFLTRQFLNKKLRWTTLGGQYDWTNKVYPPEPPPDFPSDIRSLVEGLFPMKAEAAIVNLYSPGDTLSLHRDVSESCARPLASISLGCDAIFICGLDASDQSKSDQPRVAAIRLRSGDAVVMSGESRYAWHGVSKVIAGTCPEWMREWPGDEFPDWAGWMGGKRINLNVRQMFA